MSRRTWAGGALGGGPGELDVETQRVDVCVEHAAHAKWRYPHL